MVKYTCGVCGYVSEGVRPDQCPLCRAQGDKFEASVKFTDVKSVDTSAAVEWKGHQVADRMKSEDLEDYLKMAVDLEKNRFMQNGLLRVLEDKVRPYHVAEPPLPPQPAKINSGIGVFSAPYMLLRGIGVGVVFWFVALAIGYGLGNLFHWSDFIAYIYLAIISLIGIGICLSGPLGIYSTMKKTHDDRRKQTEIYEKQMEERQKRLNDALEKKLLWEKNLPIFQQEMQKIKAQIEQTGHALQKLYAMDVIAPQFRNFVAVCSLYEFFINGECQTMGDGYKLLRQKIQHEQIISRLDLILSELEQIKNNQYLLYAAIQESNQHLNQIANATDKLVDSMKETNDQINQYGEKILAQSAIAAYCAEQSSKELAYMNRMNQYEGNYGNAWIVR